MGGIRLNFKLFKFKLTLDCVPYNARDPRWEMKSSSVIFAKGCLKSIKEVKYSDEWRKD